MGHSVKFSLHALADAFERFCLLSVAMLRLMPLSVLVYCQFCVSSV
jgi:hypothetical protein